MNSTRKAPLSLMIVAAIFVLGGLSSVLNVLISLANGRIRLDLGILGLFIGFGLVRFSPGWRTCGLFFIWLTMIGAPIFGLLFLAQSAPPTMKLLGQQIGHAPKTTGVLLAAFVFVVAFFQYRVLNRPAIRELFSKQ